ncbi:MAG: PadR family transcriptional regulator [Candidatus Helarchaeota archaeon]
MFFKRKKSDGQLGNLQTQILLMLTYRSVHGYELMEILKEIRGKVTSGLLYPTLKKLENKGYIESFTSTPLRGQKKRKNYKLTIKGLDYLQKNFFIPLADAEFYISSFQRLFEKFLMKNFEQETLVLNLLRVIGPKTVLNVLFKGKIPKTVKFMGVYEFNELIEKKQLKKWSQIILFMPFSFVFHDLGSLIHQKNKEMLDNLRAALTDDGKLWIIDIEWIKHAMVDGLVFLITGEFSRMALTFDEIKNLMLSAEFENIRKIGSRNGIMIISAEKKK